MKKLIYILSIFIITILWSCNNNSSIKSNRLIIFHAGSLSLPLKKMKEEFIKQNPEVEILLEAAGSVKCARKITDLNKECDIMASADYTVIDEMLIPEFSDWNIKFASNEMSIVYHNDSKYSNEITSDNWYKIILKDDVAYGRSDPNSDPCGYRAVLTSQLSQTYYGVEDLSKKIIQKDNEYIRPKETDLLALLETKTIDYIFLYRSVAYQHNLKFIVLPDSINLKNTNLKEFYSSASTEIAGKKPGEKINKSGQPMVYGITVLKNAPNKELAMKFVDFMLSEKGKKIMEENGQPSTVPSYSETFEAIPDKLKTYAKQSK